MFKIYMKEGPYSYDVQALVKTFYPGEGISLCDGGPLDKETQNITIKCKPDYIGISLFYGEIPIFENSIIIKEGMNYKNQLKLLLYEMLSKRTGRFPDWGTLTGVRPTKVVMALLDKGYNKNEVYHYMKEQYKASDSKIELGYKIAVKEKVLLESIDYQNGYSIYIGIPFCPTTCTYCSFTSFSAQKYSAYIEEYLKALFQEIEFSRDCIAGKKLTAVYIGGGTPTALNEDQLARLLEKVDSTYNFQTVREFTVEAGRPDSITYKKLQILKKYGVTRISINPQTMKQETLDRIGRLHTVEKVAEAFQLARKAGHDNINMDLIAGLPGENTEDFLSTLKAVENLDPDSLTIHSLVTKRAARLHLEEEDTEPEIDRMTELGRAFAEKNGYEPYYMYRQKNAKGSKRAANQENIGYARPCKEGIYNILIMEEKQTILALGAGATSKFVFHQEDRMERIENVKSLKDYIEKIDEMIDRKRKFLRREGLYGEYL